MKTHTINPLHLPRSVWGIAAILVSGLAIASLSISGQGPAEAPGAAALSAVIAPATSAHRCSECGVIESTREIGANNRTSESDAHARVGAAPLRNYEITIRRLDGTMSVIRDAKPAKWRHGELVTVIAGAD